MVLSIFQHAISKLLSIAENLYFQQDGPPFIIAYPSQQFFEYYVSRQMDWNL